MTARSGAGRPGEASGDTAPTRQKGAGGSTPGPGAGTPVCDLCGAPMIDRHCKLVCRACGYQRDCSDP